MWHLLLFCFLALFYHVYSTLKLCFFGSSIMAPTLAPRPVRRPHKHKAAQKKDEAMPKASTHCWRSSLRLCLKPTPIFSAGDPIEPGSGEPTKSSPMEIVEPKESHNEPLTSPIAALAMLKVETTFVAQALIELGMDISLLADGGPKQCVSGIFIILVLSTCATT